jgi:hypothetical protein
MPALDIRDQSIPELNIRLKYSSIDPLDAVMKLKLAACYRLARDVVQAAVDAIGDIHGFVAARGTKTTHNPATRCTGAEECPEFAEQALYSHFKIDVHSKYEFPERLAGLSAIREKYVRIQHGLNGPVAIADSRSEDIANMLGELFARAHGPLWARLPARQDARYDAR